MLRLLITQDLRQRFTGNVLGGLWAVLAPLLQLLVFAVVFVHIFKARVPGLDERGYIAFLALGMWPWFAFAEAVSRGASSLVDGAGLLGKVAVSTWQLVLARVIGAFIIHGVGFVAVLILLSVWRGGIHLEWLPVVLPGWIAMFVLALAVAQIVAICTVFARDTQQILGHLLTAWMFLTPILYAPSLVPPMFQAWMRINPMTDVIASIREPLLWGGEAVMWSWLPYVVAGVLLGLAWLVHRRFRPYVREFL
ncbi:MAG: ABC transporter permease [Xanthomonadales bacterium]|nr:ABC transporter permease [Xanthomonadales bacterium]